MNIKQKTIRRRGEKATEHHLDNLEKLKEGKPSKEELKEMYGYLDTCWACGKPLRFFEPYQHSFWGNTHKFGCNIFARTLGLIYNLIKIPIIIIIVIIGTPFYIIYLGIREFGRKLSQ